MSRRVIDVSGLPTFAFGSRSVLWWGTLCVMIIEGTMFLLALISYFYLQGTEYDWPPGATRLPDPLPATVNTGLILLSLLPNRYLNRAAEKLDLNKVRILLPVMDLFAIAFLAIRAAEFARLNIRWDDHAYGSILWTLLGLHTVHLLTDAFDTIVLTVMMFNEPVEGRRFVDVSENAFYWNFVVAAWIPIYFVVYLFPRL